MKKSATKLLERGRTSKLALMLVLMVGLFSNHLCYSQTENGDRLVSGKVVDSNGSALPGVNISVKGTSTGTITNADGTYSLGVPPSSILVFTFIGFNAVEENVGGRSVIDVTLSEDLTELDEIVVTGYGTQRKQDITGSISRVTGEEVMLPSTSTFDQMLQGRVSGVQVSQNDGAPGGNVNVLIRGVSSITGGNSPLYVVDGYPIVSSGPGGGSDLSNFGSNSYDAEGIANNIPNRINPLSAINPSDIESIEVLKDASATAIYG